MKELVGLSAARISEGIAARHFSAREVAEAALGAVADFDGEVRAFLEVTPALAYAAAARIDDALAAGAAVPALAGVPVAFKDNMNLVGTRTTCGSRMLERYESVYDCTAARRLIDAGALPIGKCNMDEFAFGSSTESSAFGPTRNPWDLERVPGGSSGGSAAAVAARMVTIALGSDTGGSIRQPGAFTGTVALKPTYGRVSRYGCVAFASSLDQIGPFATSVQDAARALSAISGKDPLDATSVDRPCEEFAEACAERIDGMRVGLVSSMLESELCSAEIRDAVLRVAGELESLGATIDSVELSSVDDALSAYYIIGPAEASSNLARFDGIRYGYRVDDADDVADLYARSRAGGFGPEVIRRIMLGTYVLSAGYYDAYYGQAQRARTVVRRDFARTFERFDVILAPTTPTVAFKIGERVDDILAMYLSDVFTIPVNLAGVCAASVPVGLSSEERLPIGVQVIADHFAESTLVRAAAAIERAMAFDAVPPRVKRGERVR